MSFIEQMQNDLRLCVLNADEFAEEIVYSKSDEYDYLVDTEGNKITDTDGYPILVNKISQASRSIKALVVREQLEPTLQNNARNLNRDMEIYILNDAIYGVTEVNKGQDKVLVSEQIGDTAVEFNVADILDQDDVAFHLLLTR